MSGRNWQGIPDWVALAVRWHHVQARAEGRRQAGDSAVEALTDKILADDPEFARVIIRRYARSLIRAPKPEVLNARDGQPVRLREHRKPGEREYRMARCARMHAEGMSLRKIGLAEGISHTRVRDLLAEWVTLLPEMDADLIRAATPLETTPAPPVNPQSPGFTAEVSLPGPNVVPLFGRSA